MSIRVALFGTKFMGKAHSQAWRNVNMFFPDAPQVEMKVIVGRNPAETEQAAESYGWQEASTDWKAVMARDDIDLVDISTPGEYHCPMVLEAAKAGKHIVCEKPLSNTVGEAKRMVKAVEKAGVRHFLMHNYRRAPAVTLAKKMVVDGRIGKIHHFRARYLQDWAMSPDLHMLWRFDKNISGSGALGDLGAHIIDLARYLCGEIAELAATTETFVKTRPVSPGAKKRAAVTVDDAVAMCVRFENGAIGTLEATRFAPGRKNFNTFEINGSKGSLSFDLENLNNLKFFSTEDDPESQGFHEIIVASKGKHPYADHWWADGHILGYEHTFIHSVADFLAVIGSKKKIHPDFTDGLRNQMVLDAAEKAARSRRWVKVS
jgi:predicted dehydrogenase